MRIHSTAWLIALVFAFTKVIIAQEPLTLQQAIEIGLRNNYSIIVAENEAMISENNASLGNAGFLPTIDATAGSNKSIFDTRQEFANGTSSERDGAETTSQNAAVNLNWTVFDGFNMFTSLKQFNTLRDIDDINAKIAVENTVADIIAVYSNIIQQQQLLTAFGEAIKISQERSSIAEGKYNIGSGSRLEWNRAKVDLIADSSAYLRQEVILADARTDLNRLLALNISTRFTITDTIGIDANFAFDNVRQTTLQQNNLLQLAQKNIRLAQLSLNGVRSEWLPEVRLNVGYDYSRSESDAGFFLFNRNRRFNYGATLSWNLFDGFNTRRESQNTRLDIENRELEYQDIQTLVDADLAKTFKRYEVSLTVVKLEDENVQLARQNVEIALQQFRLGAITSVDLREVQNNFVDSETRFIAAQLTAKLAETELLRLSGQLVQ
ncbi:MAG TPA: TolC family protein [bacterium]